jgi:acetyl esterase/lipase
MRPRDPRYTAFLLPDAPNVDASIRYLIARSPISDPYARYRQAEKMEREVLIANSKLYFQPWDAIFEANPQRILESGEQIEMPPMFILQGEFDDNVLPEVQERFVATYRAAGGDIEFEVYPGMEHRWIINPGPQTDRAIAMIEDFIARHVA